MMMHYVLPVLFALFIWWFSTGLIIFLDGLPVRTFRWSIAGATVTLGAALWGLWFTSGETSISAAYWAFACGLLAWGWQEISFYMGFVTGPRSEPCRDGCGGWRHFGHAIQTSLYHELAIIASAGLVFWLTWDQPNQVGTWTFMILWWMHQSAKLNVFLGVRNLNAEFLPEHLRFLRSFLTEKPMNLLFPFSVTVSTVIAVILATKATATGADEFQTIGYTFLATLMVLAILEHWFLVLPIPAAALWKWGLASRRGSSPAQVRVVAGFLGAGKTTFLRRMLADARPTDRTVVLVNDFASVGLDASLLGGQGAEVVELPNGCICCSLRADLSRQLADTISRWSPKVVLIEPSGVADVAPLVATLAQQDLAPLISGVEVTCIIDAGSFLGDYARMPNYFDPQARLANKLVVNKCELVGSAELRMIEATLLEINPSVAICAASFGVEQAIAFRIPQLPATGTPLVKPPVHAHEHVHAADGHDHHHHLHGSELEGLTSWSTMLDGPCDAAELETVLSAVARGEFGQVERVKGIARVGAGWIRFDVAGGLPRIVAFAPLSGEQARVVAIGRTLNELRLRAAFLACGMAKAA